LDRMQVDILLESWLRRRSVLRGRKFLGDDNRLHFYLTILNNREDVLAYLGRRSWYRLLVFRWFLIHDSRSLRVDVRSTGGINDDDPIDVASGF
jgi:hypothetical protein